MVLQTEFAQIKNNNLIGKVLMSNKPKNGPIAAPITRLSENKLIPSLFLSFGVTYAAIVPVAVVVIPVAIPLINLVNIKSANDPSIK